MRIYLSGVTRRALANSLLGCPWVDPLAALVIAADAVKGAQRLACRELLRPERERAQRDPIRGDLDGRVEHAEGGWTAPVDAAPAHRP